MLIGPESGFDENELELMKNYNWNIICLGIGYLERDSFCCGANHTKRFKCLILKR